MINTITSIRFTLSFFIALSLKPYLVQPAPGGGVLLQDKAASLLKAFCQISLSDLFLGPPSCDKEGCCTNHQHTADHIEDDSSDTAGLGEDGTLAVLNLLGNDTTLYA